MSLKILIIEDDASLRKALVMTLEDADHIVYAAGSGNEALDVFRKQSQIDLVITDVRMAGMDGIQALEYMRKIRRSMRCIVITGFADEQVPGRAIQVGAEDYLYKPFDAQALLRAVGRMESGEADEIRYMSMLGKVMSGYRSLLQGLKAAIASKGVAKIEAARHEAYQAFYVGVRSARLTRHDGLKIWDMLEQADRDLEQARTDPSVSGLAERYQYLKDLVAAVREGALGEKARPRDCLTADSYAKLHQRIHAADVTLEQIKVASHVRTLDAVARMTRPDIRSLYEALFA